MTPKTKPATTKGAGYDPRYDGPINRWAGVRLAVGVLGGLVGGLTHAVVVGIVGGLIGAPVASTIGALTGAIGFTLLNGDFYGALLGALLLGGANLANRTDLISPLRSGPGWVGSRIGIACGLLAALAGLLYFAGALP